MIHACAFNWSFIWLELTNNSQQHIYVHTLRQKVTILCLEAAYETQETYLWRDNCSGLKSNVTRQGHCSEGKEKVQCPQSSTSEVAEKDNSLFSKTHTVFISVLSTLEGHISPYTRRLYYSWEGWLFRKFTNVPSN